MGHSTCCIVNCKNTGKNSSLKFYRFPVAIYKLQQRNKWITAVQKKTSNGPSWFPKSSDRICGQHFIGNKKSENQLSPSYVPTIFSCKDNMSMKNESNIIKRHERFMKRRMHEQAKGETQSSQATLHDPMESTSAIIYSEAVENVEKQFIDQECQVNFFLEHNELSKTFVCNTYTYNNSLSDAAIQTEIIEPSILKIPNSKKYKNKESNTEKKMLVDKSVETDGKSFFGIESIKKDDEIVSLAGVTFANFNFLLRRMPEDAFLKYKISKENRLFIFLIKMKTSLTFSAISVIFSIHRTTVSRIFYSTLQHLTCATADLVFWPSKDVVQTTMPKCFFPDYSNTRVIIDCTEFRIEIPTSVDNRIYTYSHYKKGFTAKVLIGITPSGFISFKSKVAGGRKSDSQLTIESGLIDLLEEGDNILADKGFPEIRQIMDESGKKVTLVMPPFLEKKSEFTKKETEQTYNIAKVRIHVERIMQRLRTYHILRLIHENLFTCIDDIVHICCVLVNLQPPIINDKQMET